MVKELNGRELAGFIKERQAQEARRLKAEGKVAKLVIIRDSDNPVITKYVELKKKYGEDIGVEVVDEYAEGVEALVKSVERANEDAGVSGIIVQLPLMRKEWTDEVVGKIALEKDVDGLSGGVMGGNGVDGNGGDEVVRSGGVGKFDSATATAIHWLLTGYDIELAGKKIAVVGRGRLVGGPLLKMWRASGLDVTEFGRGSDLTKLIDYDIIVTATGVPHLIKSEMVKTGAVVVDAGTASENGVLVGDVDEAVRQREDLRAITPKIGGVGPLTVSVLFDHVLRAARE